MKLMFVYWAWADQGSGNVIQGYTRCCPGSWPRSGRVRPARIPTIPLNYSLDVASADAVVFIFEWTTQLQHGDQLDLRSLGGRVPAIAARDHRRRWQLQRSHHRRRRLQPQRPERPRPLGRRSATALADKIYQPTLHPRRPNVGSFLFYAYNPAWDGRWTSRQGIHDALRRATPSSAGGP